MKGFHIFQKIKKYSFDKRLYIAFFLLAFLVLSAGDAILKKQVRYSRVSVLPFPYTEAALPVLSSVLGASSGSSLHEEEPSLLAQGALVMDNDSKTVLFSKNETIRFSTASTAKIMTALVALDYYKFSDVLTIKSDGVEGSIIGFKKGERITFEGLFYAMMLPSANDAALAISQNYPGGEEAFIAKMNEKASLFHLSNTHFSDPIGLDDNGDYTTAFDLAHLASIAIANQQFANIVKTKEKIITDEEGNTYQLENLNKLLGVDGVTGIKTGFTDEAGGVLVTSKKVQTPWGNHTIILVVMKSDDRFADTEQLLSFINDNLHYKILDSF